VGGRQARGTPGDDMSDTSPRAILNHLIETCRDGVHGFEHAAGLVTDPAFKVLFTDLSRRRSHLAAELLPHAQRLGGSEAADGTTAASLHRTWMDVRSNLGAGNDLAVMAEARRGDAATVAAFKDAVEGALPATVRDLVERQYAEVRAAHEELDPSPVAAP